jgi:hypothetical protein
LITVRTRVRLTLLLDPEPLVPLTMCWRSPASSATELFVDVVHIIAAREGWTEPKAAAGANSARSGW